MKRPKEQYFACFCEKIEGDLAYLQLIDEDQNDSEMTVDVKLLTEKGLKELAYFEMRITNSGCKQNIEIIPEGNIEDIDLTDEVLERMLVEGEV